MGTIDGPFNEQLRQLARLGIHRGVNLQQGQGLLLSAPVEAAFLADLVTEEAYRAGAKDVYVIWQNDETNRLRLKYAPMTALENIPQWQLNVQNQSVKDDYAVLSIYGPNADLFDGIDEQRIAAQTKARGRGLIPYYEYMMNDRIQWSIISYPTSAWAHKVFPDKRIAEAQKELMKEILRISRVSSDSDPLDVWDHHNQKLHRAADFLNKQAFKQLHYRSEGTDLTIELPNGHIWSGGSGPSEADVWFNANIPTEEVFTLPDKRGVNGTVASKMPLNCNGQIIDHFSLTFKDGEVVSFHAEKGEEALRHLLASDEGAVRLGEVALVPHRSPVSESGLIFYNTLFDENASCHLALGKAYPTCIKNGSSMSLEALDHAGVNDSIIHEDFMIGSADLSIDGIQTDGTSIPVFRDGEWAIDFPRESTV
ncbi:aminopeptidase [Sporolactobacillus spathodeae]|uniref:Aminopeptidase n=1 Tax=Sporolactobacillus spathodeae TaxID=1465502 RepID=A0ABS2QA75_9BACL|nr:aminopeptidase [Sporolactobacillus spathodeae]